MKTLQQRFDEKWIGEPNSGCWLWVAGYDGRGYGAINVAGRMRKATHISLELAGRPVSPGYFALHKCDVPGCVNPQHLFIGTNLDNVRDCVSKGRKARGEKTRNTKLTGDLVRSIRTMAACGKSQTSIGAAMGITQSAVSRIVKREIWDHVVDLHEGA